MRQSDDTENMTYFLCSSRVHLATVPCTYADSLKRTDSSSQQVSNRELFFFYPSSYSASAFTSATSFKYSASTLSFTLPHQKLLSNSDIA